MYFLGLFISKSVTMQIIYLVDKSMAIGYKTRHLTVISLVNHFIGIELLMKQHLKTSNLDASLY